MPCKNRRNKPSCFSKQATAGKTFLETIVNGIEDQMMVLNPGLPHY